MYLADKYCSLINVFETNVLPVEVFSADRVFSPLLVLAVIGETDISGSVTC